MTAIIPFTFETSEIRSIVDGEGNPWFVARDIAKALGYVDPKQAVHDNCKKAQRVENIGGVSKTPLQNQTLIIPQSDVVRLIARSKLPAAERFQDWLFEEVVPSIMKTGGYGAQMGKQLSLVEMLDAAAAEIRAEQSRRLAVESRLTIAQQALGQETIEHKITKQELQLFTGLENSIAIESLASKLGLYPGPFKKYLLDKYVYSGGWHSGERLLAVPKDELHVLDQILVMPGMMDPRGGGWSKAVYDYLVTPYGQKLMIKRLNSGRLNSLIKTDLRIVGTK
jgi:prophage antirepressor-like protein